MGCAHKALHLVTFIICTPDLPSVHKDPAGSPPLSNPFSFFFLFFSPLFFFPNTPQATEKNITFSINAFFIAITMSLSNKLAITDVELKDKRVLIRVRDPSLLPRHSLACYLKFSA